MAKARTTFRKGDRVEWNSHGGRHSRRGVATGTVVKRVTSPMKIKGHRVMASADEPQYVVRSDNGGKAADKPTALRRTDAGSAMGTSTSGGSSEADSKKDGSKKKKDGSKKKDSSKTKKDGSKKSSKKSSKKKDGSKKASTKDGKKKDGSAPKATTKGAGATTVRATKAGGRGSIDRDDRAAIRKDFRRAVNMAPARLERWLDGDESRSVGQKKGGSGESTGHASGRRIVEIRRTKVADLTDRDYRHMRKVVGYVDRHLAQRPKGDVKETRWRYSLMNWGHDPLRR